MIDIDINNQIMLVIAAFVILLLVGNVIYIIVKDRKKDKEEINELMSAMIEEKVKPQLEEVKKVELPESQIEMVDRQAEEPKTQVEMIETKIEEPQKNFVEKKSEIEQMLEKMQQDLEAKSEDVVETFEKEQEEKSIISYQELVKTINKENNVAKIDVKEPVVEEVMQATEKELVPMSATQHILNEKVPETVVEEKQKETLAVKKFKNTDFISPIYGKMEEHFEYPKVPSFQSQKAEQEPYDIKNEDYKEDVIETFEQELEEHQINDYLEDYGFHTHMKIESLEQTLDMPPISPEIKENEEFLQALKEFRKNLE